MLQLCPLSPQEENLLVILTVRPRDNLSHHVVLLVKSASPGTTCLLQGAARGVQGQGEYSDQDCL